MQAESRNSADQQSLVLVHWLVHHGLCHHHVHVLVHVLNGMPRGENRLVHHGTSTTYIPAMIGIFNKISKENKDNASYILWNMICGVDCSVVSFDADDLEFVS